MDSRDVLIYYTSKYKGYFDEVSHAVFTREGFKKDEAAAIVESEKQFTEEVTVVDELEDGKAVKRGIITAMDIKGYPDFLKKVPEPPIVLFYKGDEWLLSNPERNVLFLQSDYPKGIDRAYLGETLDFIQKEMSEKKKKIVITLHADENPRAKSEIVSASILGGIKVILVTSYGLNCCHSDEQKMIMKNILQAGGLVVTVAPSSVRDTDKDERSEKIAEEFATKLCDEVLMCQVRMTDERTAQTVNYALTNHKELKSVCVAKEDVVEDTMNEILLNAKVVGRV